MAESIGPPGDDEVEGHVARPPLWDFRCGECGYRARSRAAPERCPMCGGTVWEFDSSTDLLRESP